MASIYIHIPFCKQACSYCNFYFSTNKKSIPLLINAIENELVLQRHFFAQSTLINTIYFGGGTPSIVDPLYLKNILNAIRNNFNLAKNIEQTIEINPDDISSQSLDQWQKLGFNRFSVGFQSFFDDDLQYLKRVHNATQSLQCLQLLKHHNISNISADLIFGIPTANLQKISHNLHLLTNAQIPHISCYGLTIEPQTLLQHNIKNLKTPNINHDQQASEFEYIMQTLPLHGFQQYEISNYALPGFKSQHNSAYWQQKPYLGIGPSAHSFNGNVRQHNINNLHLYADSIASKKIPAQEEILLPFQQYNEFVLTQLRQASGIHLPSLQHLFPLFYAHFIKQLESLKKEWINFENQHLSLSLQGKLFCDTITLHLFATA